MVKRLDAAPTSFAVGEFELVVEPLPENRNRDGPPDRLGPPAPDRQSREGPVAPTLDLCPSCFRFVWPSEWRCPFCSVDLAAARELEVEERERRLAAMADLEAALSRVRRAPRR